eukprot:jgi/Mesen1/10504/ME000083S10011
MKQVWALIAWSFTEVESELSRLLCSQGSSAALPCSAAVEASEIADRVEVQDSYTLRVPVVPVKRFIDLQIADSAYSRIVMGASRLDGRRDAFSDDGRLSPPTCKGGGSARPRPVAIAPAGTQHAPPSVPLPAHVDYVAASVNPAGCLWQDGADTERSPSGPCLNSNAALPPPARDLELILLTAPSFKPPPCVALWEAAAQLRLQAPQTPTSGLLFRGEARPMPAGKEGAAGPSGPAPGGNARFQALAGSKQRQRPPGNGPCAFVSE